MKKRISTLSIILVLVILSVVTVFAVKPDLIFNFKYNPKQSAPEIDTSVKENKTIRETYDTNVKVSKNKKMEKFYKDNANDFKIVKDRLNTEDGSERYSYIAPTGLGLDDAGTLYVDDPGNQSIKKIDTNGNIIESIDYANLLELTMKEEYNYFVDWAVNSNGCLYILTGNRLYYSKDNSNTSFTESHITFDNPQRLIMNASGNINLLDINPETMNLRVQKISASDELISSYEQFNHELDLFDFEDSAGNIVKVHLFGGSCDEELQYVITNTAYPDKEYLVAFDTEKGTGIEGLHVIGFDQNQNLYFLKNIGKTNNGNSKSITEHFVCVFSFVDGTMKTYSIGKDENIAQERDRHYIIVDKDGNIYSLETDMNKVSVFKYDIDKK